MYPGVRLRMNKILKKNKKKKIVVLDIPLLLEGKINNKKDVLIFDLKKLFFHKQSNNKDLCFFFFQN